MGNRIIGSCGYSISQWAEEDGVLYCSERVFEKMSSPFCAQARCVLCGRDEKCGLEYDGRLVCEMEYTFRWEELEEYEK